MENRLSFRWKKAIKKCVGNPITGNDMDRLFYSLVLILSALLLGYGLQRAQTRRWITLPWEIDELRKKLQKLGLLVFMPISFLGAVWVVTFDDLRVVLLPIIGVIALFSGGGLGLLAAKIMGVSRKEHGVFYCCGSFTNIGAIGGLVTFLFLGEEGFALVALYKMFEEISYYTIGFPIARYYGASTTALKTLRQRFFGVITDPFVATILSSFFIGLSLNLLEVDRPEIMELVTAFSVPLGTFVLIVSIGLGMRFTRVTDYLPHCAVISGIKFICVPAITCGVAYLLNMQMLLDGLVFKVVVILSSMPVAFNSLVAVSIYDLDLDLANSLWLVTTLMLIVVLPWLYLVIM